MAKTPKPDLDEKFSLYGTDPEGVIKHLLEKQDEECEDRDPTE